MKKIKLYIAMSLNGKIAAKNGSVDWLEAIPKPENGDYGYAEFYDSIDTTIQGYSTYKQIIDWGIEFPYSGKTNYVLSRDPDRKNTEHISFISKDHISFIKQLKEQEGKDIWLIGGGQVNTLLLNAGLVDEIMIFIMPIILQEGIELFEALPNETHLTLQQIKSFESGVVELNYKVKNDRH
jgi:dihydrofolate reductase